MATGKEKSIHLIMPFSRHYLWNTLVEHYRPMNVILHPIMFEDEAAKSASHEPWIEPCVMPGDSPQSDLLIGSRKANHFLENYLIDDNDYYALAADDDMFEPDVFDAIREMDEPVIFISLKRGHRIPEGLPPHRRYPPTTLFAKPENVVIGSISGEQYFMRGSVAKICRLDESSLVADGLLAMHLKSNYPIRYEPDLYALFNYFEPGRWDKATHPIAFGVLVNDIQRLDMVLRQSELDPEIPCHTITLPKSATKGLNELLGIMETEGNRIAVLTHQDMFYRKGWIPQVEEQIAKLPESWIVAGIIGKDRDGRLCGKLHDMRIPQHFNTWDIHEFPQAAGCFDECCIIVNLGRGFRFDETLDGFDLYGTLCVHQVLERGGTAWIIDAFAEHYCMRPFTWIPDESFIKNYKWLHDRFKQTGRVDSTVFEVPKETVGSEDSAG
jgi:hypothetical protein